MNWLAKAIEELDAKFKKHSGKANNIETIGTRLIEVWHEDLDERFRLLRKLYDVHMPDILLKQRRDPYFMDWAKVFTPIEYQLWSVIRSYGPSFYPQVPVLNYFIDFADPITKIGIEADDQEWHEKKRDMERDRRLRSEGWIIFRIKGHEIIKPEPDWEAVLDDDYYPLLDEWVMETASGIFCAIYDRYYDKNIIGNPGLVQRTLVKHCYTDI